MSSSESPDPKTTYPKTNVPSTNLPPPPPPPPDTMPHVIASYDIAPPSIRDATLYHTSTRHVNYKYFMSAREYLFEFHVDNACDA
jgi:hypothetical protein